jgi:hypothetical protein
MCILTGHSTKSQLEEKEIKTANEYMHKLDNIPTSLRVAALKAASHEADDDDEDDPLVPLPEPLPLPFPPFPPLPFPLPPLLAP